MTYGRDALIEEVWKIVLDDIVYIPLHHQVLVWAMRDNLDIPVSPLTNVPGLPRGAVQGAEGQLNEGRSCSAPPNSLIQRIRGWSGSG